jgi:hypothetical protein
MTDLEIPWALDLLHNPEARADWERRHPGRAAEMREQFPLREKAITMSITKHENEWQDKATAAAIAGAKKIAASIKGSGGISGTKQVGALNDTEWGWLVTGAIFGWVRTRVEQAIAEGVDQEAAVGMSELTPSPCDVACVTSILRELSEKAGVDWLLPLQAWSKDVMTNFLLLAWELIKRAEVARDQGKILWPSVDWDKTGDTIDNLPFDHPTS